jgi:hypothetical protein
VRRRAGSSKARWLALELPASGTQARSVDASVLGVWHQQTDAILPLAPEDSVAPLRELFAHLYQPASSPKSAASGKNG